MTVMAFESVLCTLNEDAWRGHSLVLSSAKSWASFYEAKREKMEFG
jgi:hypothetical protein